MDLLGRAYVSALSFVCLALLGAALLAPRVASATIIADFSTPAMLDGTQSPTALWNTVDQRIQAAVAANNVEINFGDGSDGAFNDGPAQTGITVSGSTISIDTNTKAVFNFSSFNLSAGKTIRATGAATLTIRVLGAATIAGTVDLSGGNGANSLAITTAPAPAAGIAGAGGGNGGDAGVGAASPATAAGLPGSGADVRGGSAGATSAVADNGGGGGCNGVDGVAANDAANAVVGGAAGACTGGHTRLSIANLFETSFLGGGGGGGGGGYSGGAAQVSGSSGGGGGGALHLTAIGPLSFGKSPSLGSIKAKGGNGGTNSLSRDAGLNCGGGGGGGSGGSIWIQASKQIGDPANPGSADVSLGAAGTDAATCADQADGGHGSLGILRVDAASSGLTGSAATASFTPTTLTGKTYAVTSKPLDSGYDNASYNTPIETQDTSSTGCGSTGTLAVAYAGSSDGVNFGAYVPKAQITTLNGNRYIRFKVTITTTGATPPCLAGLMVPLTQFTVKGGLACGTTTTAKGGKSASGRQGGSPLGALADFAVLGTAGLIALRPLSRRRRPQLS